ncbi:hypothetical protein [Companilactobacillus sp.]|uniref:hypothetical protein n=1 Tax=Companilactobacillus sp. TaxID=2767905 RepID=UPI00261EFAA0|nr:hypothetical protein [Companilactobacillus sp.]
MVDVTAKVASDSRKRASNPNRGSKPGEKRGGRVKGTPNKMTRTIKAAIEEAFHKVGGSSYLATMAIEQPAAFMTLLGKVLPTQMEHSNPDGTMSAPTRIVIEAALVKSG